jgi:phage tail-like protein
VRSLRVHYPRASYLEYLPAVYSSDDESRWFLERFLSIFQTEWDGIERCINDAAGLFDPKAVPGGKALEYLASWFALPLEGGWSVEKKRRLLSAIAKIYFGSWKVTSEETVCLVETDAGNAARRGTREGLRRYLQVYLENITGIEAGDQGGFPQIDEGFRERQRLMLALGDTSSLSHSAPLWSPSAVGRLHLGSYSRTGEARLVSTGDPEHEIFQEFAHRFRVFVPSSWIKTAKDEEMVHRALREEKPAHTSYDLCLVESRFRVGLQSTVGVDTILGAWPKARLACTHDTNIPPSRLPRHCLGLDTVLAAPPGDIATMQVGPGTRAGIDTILN